MGGRGGPPPTEEEKKRARERRQEECKIHNLLFNLSILTLYSI